MKCPICPGELQVERIYDVDVARCYRCGQSETIARREAPAA